MISRIHKRYFLISTKETASQAIAKMSMKGTKMQQKCKINGIRLRMCNFCCTFAPDLNWLIIDL